MQGCSKSNVVRDQLRLAEQMLSDKTWYLDYSQTITNGTVKMRTYVGQSTYFISFMKDKTTLDSDGISGAYSVDNASGPIVLTVTGKTQNGTAISYNYTIESVGADNLIASYIEPTTNTTIKQFFIVK